MNHKSSSLEYIISTRTSGANPFKIFEDINRLNPEAIYWAIKKIGYSAFLQTAYWFAVSSVVKSRAGMRCQVCNSGNGIQVHHRTYDTHGREHLNMTDLVVLCDNCHGLFHGHTSSTPVIEKPSRFRLPKNFTIPHKPEVIDVPEAEKVVLTEELIEKCRTDKGAFTNATVRAFGVHKSIMQKGWVKRLEGTTISRSAYIQAVEGRFVFASGPLDW